MRAAGRGRLDVVLATLDWLEWFNDRRHHRELATPADSETPDGPLTWATQRPNTEYPTRIQGNGAAR